MKHTEEEILNALKVIKEVCEGYDPCPNCPLYATEANCCGIQYRYAEDWELNDGTRMWRAFR